ncbi:hypothetical protein PM082_006172 [Marasmius tenuissimus]|nr:hypothetical protein PM082_006172 [Marasmius tenuissimus]
MDGQGLVYRYAELTGGLWHSPDTIRRRRRQSLYLFVHLPPPDFDDNNTYSPPFWSFHEDGQHRLSRKACDYFGVSSSLSCSYRGPGLYSYSWSTNDYKHLHEYQLGRGFDPKTINFARHLGYGDNIFQPIDDSDRFEEVLEENFGISDNSDGFDDTSSEASNDTSPPDITLGKGWNVDDVADETSQERASDEAEQAKLFSDFCFELLKEHVRNHFNEGSDSSDSSVSGDLVDLSNVPDLQPVMDADYYLQLRIARWLKEIPTTISEGSDSGDGSVSGDPVDLSNASDPQSVEDADSWGSPQLRIERWLRESATAISLDDVASTTDPGELETGDRPYQDPLHKDVAASNDIFADCLQPCSSGSASGCNHGADSPAGNVTGGADTAPSIHSEVNSVVTTRHDIDNNHNVGGVDISHVSPFGDADSRVHDDGPAVQLTPPPKLIRTSRMRIITPFASLIPRVSATPRPSLTTAQDLWGPFGSSLSDSGAPAASRRGQRHRLVSSSSTGDQDGDSAVD